MYELFAARVGLDVCSGTGWIVPIVKRADWPLGRLSITKETIRVSVVLFGNFVDVPWANVTGIKGTWTGMTFTYDDLEVDLYSPFLWQRFQSALRSNCLQIADLATEIREPEGTTVP